MIHIARRLSLFTSKPTLRHAQSFKHTFYPKLLSTKSLPKLDDKIFEKFNEFKQNKLAHQNNPNKKAGINLNSLLTEVLENGNYQLSYCEETKSIAMNKKNLDINNDIPKIQELLKDLSLLCIVDANNNRYLLIQILL